MGFCKWKLNSFLSLYHNVCAGIQKLAPQKTGLHGWYLRNFSATSAYVFDVEVNWIRRRRFVSNVSCWELRLLPSSLYFTGCGGTDENAHHNVSGCVWRLPLSFQRSVKPALWICETWSRRFHRRNKTVLLMCATRREMCERKGKREKEKLK